MTPWLSFSGMNFSRVALQHLREHAWVRTRLDNK
jgi:hypothetical protein